MRQLRTARLLAPLVLAASCAAAPPAPAPREAVSPPPGPVTWEVIDVGHILRADGMESRWSFTVVLRETAGSAVQFERVERGTYGDRVEIGSIARWPFRRRLEARSEIRDPVVQTWGWSPAAGLQFGGASTLGNLTIERRYVGRDAAGREVVVPVRIELHRGFGRPSRQPKEGESPLPPAQPLREGEISKVAGRWEGYTRDETYRVPVEAVIREDGMAEFLENDPPTIGLRVLLRVRDGRLVHAGRGPHSAEFVLHGEGPSRVLMGHFTLATAGDAPPLVVPLRLDWTGRPGDTGPLAAPRPPSPRAPAATTAGD